MLKIFFMMLFFILSLNARENPFFPVNNDQDIPYTSNKDNSSDPLKRATISLPTQARVIQKVTIEYKNLDGSLESRSIDLDNSIDWHLPIFISQNYDESSNKTVKSKEKKEKYKKLASIKFASFYTSDKNLKVLTKDKLLRNFLLVQPHRIVLDFKRDASIKTLIKNHENSVFTKLKVGNHSGYYRAVIELDGHYRYKIKKTSNGYIFSLK